MSPTLAAAACAPLLDDAPVRAALAELDRRRWLLDRSADDALAVLDDLARCAPTDWRGPAAEAFRWALDGCRREVTGALQSLGGAITSIDGLAAVAAVRVDG